jgi:hypothetical protein
MKILNKTIQRIFNLPDCKWCGSLNLDKGYYIRGWNNWCNQACGDNGNFCNNCCKITFAQSLESYKNTLPNWCTPGNN